MLANFTQIIHQFCQENADNDEVGQMVSTLAKLNQQWRDLTSRIAMQSTLNSEAVGAAAVDYLYFSGYVTLGYLWARTAILAKAKLAEFDADLSTDKSL